MPARFILVASLGAASSGTGRGDWLGRKMIKRWPTGCPAPCAARTWAELTHLMTTSLIHEASIHGVTEGALWPLRAACSFLVPYCLARGAPVLAAPVCDMLALYPRGSMDLLLLASGLGSPVLLMMLMHN